MTVTLEPGAPPEMQPTPRRRPGRRRRATVAALALGVPAVCVTAVTGLGFPGADDAVGEPGSSPRPPATTQVTRQTLEDVVDADGTLGYGTATEVGSRTPGTVTWLPVTNQVVRRGGRLFEVDAEPVTLLYGGHPAYRPLQEGSEGRDVRQLESNLRALGYRAFTVDDYFSAATADAVARWQEDLGVEGTGVVDLGDVVFAPGAVRIDSVSATLGGQAPPGQALVSFTDTAPAVTVELEPVDLRLAEVGAAVTVTLPDGREVRGRVGQVTTRLDPGTAEEQPETVVEVTVRLVGGRARTAASRFPLAAVDAAFTAGVREDVLTVPVAALLARNGGGFALEVVEGQRTRVLPVTTGLFGDGLVEVSGRGLREGMTVGTAE